ncbi:MAG: hypothetical protein WAQ33_09220 [Gaiellaceae bacterium]
MGRSAVLGAVLACTAFVAVWAAAANTPAAPTASAGGGCGSGRWQVKTMTDTAAGSVNLSPRTTTVAALRRLPAPTSPRRTRIKGVETTTYQVPARLVKMRLERDGDVLLVVIDPKTHGKLVVEFPAIGCIRSASGKVQPLMRNARAALIAACGQPDRGSFTRVGGQATITGVGFFEPGDGVSDAAPNGIELHPVLGFRMTECSLGA